MKKRLKLSLACTLALSALVSNVLATPVIVDWTSGTVGTPGAASGTLAGVGSVSYSGDMRGIESNTTLFNNASYLGQTPFTPNLTSSDAIRTYGATGFTNTLTFDSAVLNPILWINSLGRGGGWDPPSLYVQSWTFTSPFTLVSSYYQAVAEGLHPYQMTQNGNTLIGQEGHGTIQFAGSFTSISWTSNLEESSAAFQVGYDNTNVPPPPPAVPDQGSMVLIPIALGFLILGQRFFGRSRVRT